MNCMKCGREIEPDQVFCENCLAEMEQYPVRPDTVVQLPHRAKEQPQKKAHQRRRQNMTAEEQLASLRKRHRNLILAFLVMIMLAVGLGVLAGVTIKELDMQKILGQNYSTIETTVPTEG